MKEYENICNWQGSQDGRIVSDFVKGKKQPLSDELANVAIKEKWVKVSSEKKSGSKAR